jgi:prepilin signal peptidase PulO-like enzyme (type II secretory pathway)
VDCCTKGADARRISVALVLVVDLLQSYRKFLLSWKAAFTRQRRGVEGSHAAVAESPHCSTRTFSSSWGAAELFGAGHGDCGDRICAWAFMLKTQLALEKFAACSIAIA